MPILVLAAMVAACPDCDGDPTSSEPPERDAITSVIVSPDQAAILPGEQQQFTATAHGEGGQQIAGVSFEWSSDDPNVATVDDSGLATGVAEGVAGIAAVVESGTVRGTATLTVEAEPASGYDRIAFASNRDTPDGTFELYSVALDGSDVRRLTHTRCAVYDPTDSGSSNWPAWSNGGERIAFSRRCPPFFVGEPDVFDIVSVRFDGADARELTAGSGGTGPSWSPTDDMIAYAADQEIRVVGPDGSGDRRVASTLTIDAGLGQPTTTSQAWYSDDQQGALIAFSFDGVTIPVSILFTNLEGELFQFAEINDGGYDNQLPAVGPDGTIAFVSDRSGNLDIWLFDPTGLTLTQLTTHQTADSHPAWSPDGTEVAFTSARDGDLDIYVIDRDTGSARQVTDHPAADVRPTWSPRSP